MKIAHISDLHFDLVFKKNNILKTQDLLREMLREGFDHLVVTGDISDNSSEEDYFIFRKMLSRFGLLDPEKTTVTIGNHDIFGGVQRATDIFNFPSKCLSVNYEEKVRQFRDHFSELFVNSFHEDTIFPFVKTIGDYSIVAFNSVAKYSRFKNPFASNGKIQKEQLETAKNLLEKSGSLHKSVIALVHHHFYKKTNEANSPQTTVWSRLESHTLKLRGKKAILEFFRNNKVELVLHGHSHEMKEYYRKDIRLMNAGASVDNGDDNLAQGVLIDFSGNQLKTMIKTVFVKSRKRKFFSDVIPEKIIQQATLQPVHYY